MLGQRQTIERVAAHRLDVDLRALAIATAQPLPVGRADIEEARAEWFR